MTREKAIPWASLLLAIMGTVLAFAGGEDDITGAAGVVLVTVGFCGFAGLRVFYITPRNAIPDFLTVFLVFQVINKILTFLSLTLRDYGEGMYWERIANNYRWQAEMVFLASTVLFWMGWRLVIRRPTWVPLRELSSRQLAAIYFASLFLYLLTGVLFNIAALGVLVSLFRAFGLGAVTVMLFREGPYTFGRARSIIPLAMLIPFAYLSLQSGSKSDLVIVTMPVLLAALRRLTVLRLMILIAFTAAMFAFIVPLTSEIRNANWFRNEDIGLSEATARVESSWQAQGLLETARLGAMEFVHRASSAESGALVMSLVDRDGHIGSETIKGWLAIFVPRILWPDKPLYAPGAWFTWYIGEAESPETATTSTAMMLGTELFWMYGVMGVLVGMLGLGALYAATWRALAAETDTSVLSLASVLAFLVMAIRLEESAVIYAISAPVIFLGYVKAIAFGERVFFARPRSA